MVTASFIRFETVGKTAESGNGHGLFYRRNNRSVNACSEITVGRRFEREFESRMQEIFSR
jgi:hypothetical protein